MALVTITGLKAVADLDLQIRRGGGHLDPEIRWEPFFWAPRASVWSTNKRVGRGSKGFPLTTSIMFNYLPKKLC